MPAWKVRQEKVEDPYYVPDAKVETTPWADLSTGGKVKRVLWEWFGKAVLLLLLLYLFICSLDFLSSAFRLLGGKAAGNVFAESQLLSNPVAGMMIGVLVTVLVQSSSTSTSIVVTMVAADIVSVRLAVPIIMGANIGTSVTNTIVSLGHISDRDGFRRAFAGSTVHDMFNWLSVLIFLPLEAATGYLFQLSKAIVSSLHIQTNEDASTELLKVITKPFAKLIVQVDKNAIKEIALGQEGAEEKRMNKVWCQYDKVTSFRNVSGGVNVTLNQSVLVAVETKIPRERCQTLFSQVDWSDSVVGVVLLVLALVILCVCLFCIVKLLHSILRTKMAMLIKKVINADFPGKLSFLTGYLAILCGAGITFLVQSSSIFTSALVPLVGVGIVNLDRVYPLTLGSNIGTTTTAILASLTASGEKLENALQIALCHLFFNLSGILIWYPVPFMRNVPIRLAKFLGNTTAKYRWFALVYLFFMFFLLPAGVFALSLAGWQVVLGVLLPIALLLVIIAIIKVIQNKRPQWLPTKLRDWKFLPLPLRSLAPYDKIMQKLLCCCKNSEEVEGEKEAEKKENTHGNGVGSNGHVGNDIEKGVANDAYVMNERL